MAVHRKVKFGAHGAAVGGFAVADVLGIVQWAASEYCPGEIAPFVARLGMASIMWGMSFAAGWFFREDQPATMESK